MDNSTAVAATANDRWIPQGIVRGVARMSGAQAYRRSGRTTVGRSASGGGVHERVPAPAIEQYEHRRRTPQRRGVARVRLAGAVARQGEADPASEVTDITAVGRLRAANQGENSTWAALPPGRPFLCALPCAGMAPHIAGSFV